ncbi:MAG: acetyltransferase [Sulfurovum sp.]|nr:acetyltransferase [Sulfurovum sp.]
MKLYILGSSLYAEEIADYIISSGTHHLSGFIEGQDQEKCSRELLERPILWIDDISELDENCRGICAVGSPKRKKFIEQAQSKGLKFTTFAHPGAFISSSATLGTGSIVGAGSIIAVKTSIGAHTIINRGCLIGHHVTIGDYVTISPGANIAGKTVIGDGSYIAMGAIILDGITIGKNVVVGAGAVVTKDVPDNVQVVGLPARIVKEFT